MVEEFNSQYLQFREVDVPTKTKRWDIYSKSSGWRLGTIKWFSHWRQYCFFPERQTIWNKGCLADIQKFIEQNKDSRNI